MCAVANYLPNPRIYLNCHPYVAELSNVLHNESFGLDSQPLRHTGIQVVITANPFPLKTYFMLRKKENPDEDEYSCRTSWKRIRQLPNYEPMAPSHNCARTVQQDRELLQISFPEAIHHLRLRASRNLRDCSCAEQLLVQPPPYRLRSFR